jgi:hypothetical protein
VKMLRFLLPLALALPAFPGPAYQVAIDTSLLAGTDGAIYLQFNPGSGAASVTIDPFAIGTGTLLAAGGPGSLPPGGFGDFSGSLEPPPLTLSNTSGLNDYLQYLTFGDLVSFTVTFNVTPPASATFSFAATANDGLTPLLIPTGDPNAYYLGDISFDEQAAFTQNIYSPDVASITSADIPEPATVALMLTGLALFAIRRRP